MSYPALLPERHPTRDFFIADIFDNLPVKDDIASMETPFFTLATKPDLRTLVYEQGVKSVKVVPSALGLPTIFDKDVLLYCASHVIELMNRGEHPCKTLRISVHDLMVATNRDTSGKAYELFEKCLTRLRSCTVTTTIKTGGSKSVEGFGLIEAFRYVESARVKGRAIGLEITLSDWFYRSLLAKDVLTINRDYFRLRKPIERRVYEIARKHCGNQQCWSLSLDRLFEKSGSLSEVRKFRLSMKLLAERDHLPDYNLSYDRKTDMVTFSNRNFKVRKKGNIGRSTAVPEALPPKLIEDVRRLSRGHDIYMLWEEWLAWNRGKGGFPVNWKGSFIGFVRKKTSST